MNLLKGFNHLYKMATFMSLLTSPMLCSCEHIFTDMISLIYSTHYQPSFWHIFSTKSLYI